VARVALLSHRRRQAEWMDRADADPGQLRESLRFIERVNRWLGYARATLSHLEGFSREWKAGERIEILDLASGSADIPRAILKWAASRGFDLRVVGVERQGTTIAIAREKDADWRSRLGRSLALPRFVQADALALPFEAGSFDYVTAHNFLHHLSDDQACAVMRRMGEIARRGVIIGDLLRHYRAYAWIWLLTLASGPMVRHDAKVSVGQSFKREEILRLRDRAGLDFVQYYRHFGHRFVLAGPKPSR
jgi:SAM-dependent methyltransferase